MQRVIRFSGFDDTLIKALSNSYDWIGGCMYCTCSMHLQKGDKFCRLYPSTLEYFNMTTPTLLSIVSKYNMYTHFWCCRTKTYCKYILVLHTNKSHSALYIICNTLILHILNDRKTESMILLSLLCDGFKKYSCTAHCIFWHWILYIASHCIGTLNLKW